MNEDKNIFNQTSATNGNVAQPINSIPAVEKPAIEPITEAPAVEPITETPTIEPIAETPTIEPVAEAPAIEPVAETPTIEPIAETPTIEPIAETPAIEPAAEAPAIEPIPATSDDPAVQKIDLTEPVKPEVTNNDSQEKPKKSNGKKFIIFLLVLVILGVGGYAAYDKGLFDGLIDKYIKQDEKDSKKSKKEDNNSEKQENLAEEKIYSFASIKGLYKGTTKMNQNNQEVDVNANLYLWEDGTFIYQRNTTSVAGNYTLDKSVIKLNYLVIKGNGATEFVKGDGSMSFVINEDGTLTDKIDEATTIIQGGKVIGNYAGYNLTKASGTDETAFLGDGNNENNFDFIIKNANLVKMQ